MKQYVPCGLPFYLIHHHDTDEWLKIDPEIETGFNIDEYMSANKHRGLRVECHHLVMPKHYDTIKVKRSDRQVAKGFSKVTLDNKKRPAKR